MVASNVGVLARQYLANRGGFRKYVHQQAFLMIPPLLIRAAQELIPAIRAEHIELKVTRWVSVHSCFRKALSAW